MSSTTRPRRAAVVLLAVVGLVGSAGASTAVAAEDRPRSKKQILREWDRARCGVASTTPVRDGQPLDVALPPGPPITVGRVPAAAWEKPASSDPTWQLYFYSLAWLRGVAKRAFEDDQSAALARIVDTAADFYVGNPDLGVSRRGWDEGSSLRRLENINCLYILTHDERLATAMAAEANVLTGSRYYGPPHHPVHNHGLMANLHLKRSGQLLGRQDWTDTAASRMRHESDLAFSAKGTSMEQSAAYHLVNTNMWRTAAARLEELDPKDPTAATIRTTIDKATTVGRWFTEPDGDLVQIGDTRRIRGLAPTGEETDSFFRDDEAGFIAGRSSWSTPKATYYTLRSGPPRFAHGHPDKGAVTWSTSGVRVLVGPGYYSYDWSDPYASYARKLDSHNVSWPDKGRYDLRGSAIVHSQRSFSPEVHSWKVMDSLFGASHVRTVDASMTRRQLTVADSYAGRRPFRQSWHLDPEWTLVTARGKRLVFTHPEGRTLRVTTTGTYIGRYRGHTRPVAGWNFPTTGSRVPAWSFLVGGTGTVRTTFTVS